MKKVTNIEEVAHGDIRSASTRSARKLTDESQFDGYPYEYHWKLFYVGWRTPERHSPYAPESSVQHI